jgi:hypothetical protein
MARIKLGKEFSFDEINKMIGKLKRLGKAVSGRQISLKVGSRVKNLIVTRIKKRSGLPYSKKYRKRRDALNLVKRAVVEIGASQVGKAANKRKPPVSYKVSRNADGSYKVFVGWYSGFIGKKSGHTLSGLELARIRENRRRTMYLESSEKSKALKTAEALVNRALFLFKRERKSK